MDEQEAEGAVEGTPDRDDSDADDKGKKSKKARENLRRRAREKEMKTS